MLSLVAQVRDLTGLYTITTINIKFKNAFRAYRQMCIKGSLVLRGRVGDRVMISKRQWKLNRGSNQNNYT